MNLSDIKSIKIGYENCETFEVDASHIKHLSFLNIKKKYSYYNFPHKRYLVVNDFEIIVSSEADQIGSLWMEDERKPFERTTTYSDIVDFIVEYQDGTEETFFAPWKGDEYTNLNQSSNMDKDGNLMIKINKKKSSK